MRLATRREYSLARQLSTDRAAAEHILAVVEDQGLAGGDGFLRLLDQTRLPVETVYLECRTVEDVWQAVKRLSVTGPL